MKKLFQLKIAATGARLAHYAETKKQAKALRDKMNADKETAGVVVTRGPDHWRSK
jgi:hypothetical protein